MSFEEKSAWITGVAVLICWAWYVMVATSNLAIPEFIAEGYRRPLIVSVVLALVVIIASFIAVSALSPKAAGERDERDRDIERFGDQVGQFVMGIAALGVLGMALIELDYFWIATLIYSGLVLSEVAGSAARIAGYRFGIHQR